jgi:hypothetical protein
MTAPETHFRFFHGHQDYVLDVKEQELNRSNRRFKRALLEELVTDHKKNHATISGLSTKMWHCSPLSSLVKSGAFPVFSILKHKS